MTTKSKLALGVILAMMTITAFLLAFVPVAVSSKLQEKHQEDVKKEQKEEKFSAWLDRLAALECRNCTENYKHLDTNGKFSYGCLQFQLATFRSQAAKYDIEFSEGDGIYSCQTQRIVATAMFRDNPQAAAQHWYHSIYTKGLGLPPNP